MKINIKGGEYSLLMHIINKEKLNLVDNNQIRFHKFVDAAIDKKKIDYSTFKKIHNKKFELWFILENWGKRIFN